MFWFFIICFTPFFGCFSLKGTDSWVGQWWQWFAQAPSLSRSNWMGIVFTTSHFAFRWARLKTAFKTEVCEFSVFSDFLSFSRWVQVLSDLAWSGMMHLGLIRPKWTDPPRHLVTEYIPGSQASLKPTKPSKQCWCPQNHPNKWRSLDDVV